MSLITRILVVLLFIIGGCFPIVIRKKKMRCQRKGKSCSCTDYQTSSQESIDSIDSMSVVEPTTWQMPPKGRKRTRTISGASNFSGTSNLSTLSDKDRMWLQAFRFAGRWEWSLLYRHTALFTLRLWQSAGGNIWRKWNESGDRFDFDGEHNGRNQDWTCYIIRTGHQCMEL